MKLKRFCYQYLLWIQIYNLNEITYINICRTNLSQQSTKPKINYKWNNRTIYSNLNEKTEWTNKHTNVYVLRKHSMAYKQPMNDVNTK
jgi:hypothetical protein